VYYFSPNDSLESDTSYEIFQKKSNVIPGLKGETTAHRVTLENPLSHPVSLFLDKMLWNNSAILKEDISKPFK